MPAAERTRLMCASHDGDIAFAAVRVRVQMANANVATSPHGGIRVNEERLVRLRKHNLPDDASRNVGLQVQQLNSVTLQHRHARSPPVTIACNDAGNMCAIIRVVYSLNEDVEDDDEELVDVAAKSIVEIWDIRNGEPKLFDLVQAPLQCAVDNVRNAQSLIWSGNRLIVLFSNRFVHPTGTVVGETPPPTSANASYCIAQYCANAGVDALDVDIVQGPFNGTPVAIQSSNASGQEFVVTVGSIVDGETVDRVRAVIHRLDVDDVGTLDPEGDGTHRGSTVLGVGLAPAGDVLVTVESTFRRGSRTIWLHVHVRDTAGGVFVSRCRHDITHMLTTVEPDFSPFDAFFGASNFDQLVLPFEVKFSPCGRYAAMLSLRARWNVEINNGETLLAIDLARRNDARRAKSCHIVPMLMTSDTAIRSLHWTRGGIWLEGRYDALLLATR